MGIRASIRLGRIFGIPVGLDWSLLAIVALLTFSLAGGQLPSEFPGYSPLAYWSVGLVTAVVFFGCVLAHELSHAVVARHEGTEVRGITLWLLGGLAQLEGDAKSAGAEFRIAVAGPVMSFVLAAGFAAAAVLVSTFALPGLLGSALAWLALINAVLALFNLIPAAPLDGGRILTAAVWAHNRDQNRAISTASRVGTAFGWLLVGLGALQWLTGMAIGGLWTALIGWFVLSAARQEGEVARARRALGSLRVGDVMTPDPRRARGWLSVETFVAEDAPSVRDTVVPVEQFDGSIAGVITLERLRAVPPHERSWRRVGDLCLPLSTLRTAAPEERLVDVMLRPAPARLPHVLVFDGTRLMGIVGPADIDRASHLHALRDPGSRDADVSPGSP